MISSTEVTVMQRWLENLDPAFVFLLAVPFVVAIVGISVELYEHRKAAKSAAPRVAQEKADAAQPAPTIERRAHA